MYPSHAIYQTGAHIEQTPNQNQNNGPNEGSSKTLGIRTRHEFYKAENPTGRALSSSCVWILVISRSTLASVLQAVRRKVFNLFHKDQIRKPRKLKALPLAKKVAGAVYMGNCIASTCIASTCIAWQLGETLTLRFVTVGFGGSFKEPLGGSRAMKGCTGAILGYLS